MRQSKQLIPVVASSSSRDKAKGKATAAPGPKHGPLAAPGTGSAAGTAVGRSKAGIEGAKRGEEAPSGPHVKHMLSTSKSVGSVVITQRCHAKTNIKTRSLVTPSIALINLM